MIQELILAIGYDQALMLYGIAPIASSSITVKV